MFRWCFVIYSFYFYALLLHHHRNRASAESYITLNNINSFGTPSGKPTETLRIADCGMAFPLPPPSRLLSINLTGEEDPDDREDLSDGEFSFYAAVWRRCCVCSSRCFRCWSLTA